MKSHELITTQNCLTGNPASSQTHPLPSDLKRGNSEVHEHTISSLSFDALHPWNSTHYNLLPSSCNMETHFMTRMHQQTRWKGISSFPLIFGSQHLTSINSATHNFLHFHFLCRLPFSLLFAIKIIEKIFFPPLEMCTQKFVCVTGYASRILFILFAIANFQTVFSLLLSRQHFHLCCLSKGPIKQSGDAFMVWRLFDSRFSNSKWK